MKLKVGIPYAKHGRITDATLKSVSDLRASCDFDVTIVAQQGSNVPRSRNAMINGEQSNHIYQKLDDFDYFLCVDADTGFAVEHVHQLIAHDLDIVSGAYLHKQNKKQMVAGWFSGIEGISLKENRVSADRTGLFEVDWCGAGFLLLKREALESMPYPWFTCIEVEYDSPEGKCAQITSDDIGFCMKARQNGKKIMLDADCRVAHVAHPNEKGGSLPDALNDLLRSRETIIKHVQAMTEENKLLKEKLSSD
ncbi:hypothetical protein [Pseudodesulfovibrio sp. zrk46]|uniref:hypothetical protein n=1 Tax=Pseudodesulfovibrio sp. zrk46 TaxID=2725288 RepID=UPI00144928E0|nr:hypothetical protein [Pseudodesulfovibrio sp. zrk46]QJB55001.1 hypothetical protein HFN16_00680 [Pseudodesulfovibrio sp. zrk46]